MSDAFSRTALVIGREGIEKLARSAVAVFGIGGVGSYAVEALARSGVGALVLVDDDVVSESNINRQVHATRRTIGRPKVEVMRERVLEINPDIRVVAIVELFKAENADRLLTPGLEYVVDAIDTISCKIELIMRATEAGIPVMSSMGAGHKLDPTRLEVADIYSTSICPLARVMRKELRRRGLDSLKVVYSREAPIPSREDDVGGETGFAVLRPGKSRPTGSVPFVPPVAGFIIAAEVVKDLLART